MKCVYKFLSGLKGNVPPHPLCCLLLYCVELYSPYTKFVIFQLQCKTGLSKATVQNFGSTKFIAKQ